MIVEEQSISSSKYMQFRCLVVGSIGSMCYVFVFISWGKGEKLECLLCNLVHSQGFSCYRSILKHQLNCIKLLSHKRARQISKPELIPQLWISSYSSWPRFTKEHGMGRFCDYYNQNLMQGLGLNTPSIRFRPNQPSTMNLQRMSLRTGPQ